MTTDAAVDGHQVAAMGPVSLLDALVGFRPGPLDLGLQLAHAHLERGDLTAQLQDAADAFEVDALLLREALHLAQQRDIAR